MPESLRLFLPTRPRRLLGALAALLLGHLRRPGLPTLKPSLAPQGDGGGVFLRWLGDGGLPGRFRDDLRRDLCDVPDAFA